MLYISTEIKLWTWDLQNENNVFLEIDLVKRIDVFRNMMLCSLLPEDGGSRYLKND
jgi:hypothetical protein